MKVQSALFFGCLMVVAVLLTACAQAVAETAPPLSDPAPDSTPLPSATSTSPAPTATFAPVVMDPEQFIPPVDLTPQATALANPNGLAIEVILACADGMGTYITIRTELDLDFWGLSPDDFQEGGTYLETGIGFFENGQIFTSNSSGARYEPEFDLSRGVVRVEQAFLYPRSPSHGSIYTINTEMYLLEISPDYQPPAGAVFVDPGTLKLPADFRFPVNIQACP